MVSLNFKTFEKYIGYLVQINRLFFIFKDNDTIKHLFETVLHNDQNDISVQMNKEKTE